MQAVFLIIGRWDYTVLLGNLLGYVAIVLNHFGIGLTVQKALEKEEKEAKQTMQLSSTVRMLLLFGVAVIGVTVPVFHMVASLIPLLFPRIAITLRMFGVKGIFDCKKHGKWQGEHQKRGEIVLGLEPQKFSCADELVPSAHVKHNNAKARKQSHDIHDAQKLSAEFLVDLRLDKEIK